MTALIFIAITSSACPPCHALHKDFADDPRVQWASADDAGVRERYRVRSVPVVIAVRDGQEIGRRVGYKGKDDLERWMQSMQDRQNPSPAPIRRRF